jgi:hypothetical protein
VQALLSLNSKTFGITGFIYGAARGNLEDILSVLGLVSGGFAVGVIEGIKPTIRESASIPLILSGLLVGVGAKVRPELCQSLSSSSPSHRSCFLRIDGQRLHIRVLIVPLLCLEMATFTDTTISPFP